MSKNSINIGLINLVPDEDAPPTNLVLLGTYLKNRDIHVRIIDTTYDNKALAKGLDELDIIGISSMTPSYSKAIALSKELKKKYGKPIILGGPHISLVPNSLTKDFTAGAIGEGEQVLLEICNSLKKQGQLDAKTLSSVPGIVYWDDTNLIINKSRDQIKDLNTLPIPDFTLLNRKYFNKRWLDWSGKTGISMHISTSRGCPYNCIFCSGQKLWGKVRFKSPYRILEEIKELSLNLNVDHIVIDDDLFLSSKKRLQELAWLMKKSEMPVKPDLLCSARANLINDDMCRLLKRIGVKSLNFGFESGSDRTLKYLKGGNVIVAQNRKAILLCQEYGFEVSGNLIIGSPDESLKDMQETIDFMDFAIKHGAYKVGVFVMTPLPATPVWNIAKGKKLVDDNMNWDMLSFYNYKNPMLLDERVNIGDFIKIFKKARNKSYSGWLKKRWGKILINDYRRVLRKILENPKRTVVMFNNIFLMKQRKV